MSGFADLFARYKLLPIRTPGEASDQLLKLSRVEGRNKPVCRHWDFKKSQ